MRAFKRVRIPAGKSVEVAFDLNGKKDKINKIDIVGFLSKKGGLGRDDVGRVDVKDLFLYKGRRSGN